MIIINDKMITDEVIKEQFLCNLSACKGACCWEGDLGAPLERKELKILEAIYEDVKPFLTEEGKAVIEEKGTSVYYREAVTMGTPLIANGACAYLTYEANGIAKCGIEKAYEAGITDFKKPISCHLYPIRVKRAGVFEVLDYDEWDICSAACELGKKHQLPVYKFLKDAIIRKYGADFYEQLEAGAEGVLNKDL